MLEIPVSVLMGANIASEVAMGQFCESTIGSLYPEQAETFKLMLDTRNFRINIIDDVQGVELCGALKNIVAIAAGLVDGLGLGENTKAAVIRIGLIEMKHFSEIFHTLSTNSKRDSKALEEKRQKHLSVSCDMHGSTRWETYFENCGIADLITTCFGGRNRKLAEMHARTGKSFEQLEEEVLNGQKLQGPSTAKEVYQILKSFKKTNDFPLFVSVYKACYENLPSDQFIDYLSSWSIEHHTHSNTSSLSASPRTN
jgi:glycerol-3-phosphate dehydrogenase (NAD+)